jgi:hypothetical protein
MPILTNKKTILCDRFFVEFYNWENGYVNAEDPRVPKKQCEIRIFNKLH